MMQRQSYSNIEESDSFQNGLRKESFPAILASRAAPIVRVRSFGEIVAEFPADQIQTSKVGRSKSGDAVPQLDAQRPPIQVCQRHQARAVDSLLDD